MQESQQVLEWQNKAKLDAKKEALLQVMSHRFGSPVSSDLTDAVRRLDDPEELSRWIEAASLSKNLEAFRTRTGAKA